MENNKEIPSLMDDKIACSENKAKEGDSKSKKWPERNDEVYEYVIFKNKANYVLIYIDIFV